MFAAGFAANPVAKTGFDSMGKRKADNKGGTGAARAAFAGERGDGTASAAKTGAGITAAAKAAAGIGSAGNPPADGTAGPTVKNTSLSNN